MNTMFTLQLLGSLNPLPRTRNLNQNPILLDPKLLVQLNDVQGFIDRGLFIEGEAGVYFGRYAARDDFEDFLAEFNEETVESGVDLVVYVAALFFAVGDCCVDDF